MSQESRKRTSLPPLYHGKNRFEYSIHPYTCLRLDGAAYLFNLIADMRKCLPPTRLEYALSLVSLLIEGHDEARADERRVLTLSAPGLSSVERRYDRARRTMDDILEFLERTKHSKSKLTHRERDIGRRPSEKVADDRWFEVMVDDLEKLQRQLYELQTKLKSLVV